MAPVEGAATLQWTFSGGDSNDNFEVYRFLNHDMTGVRIVNAR